MQNTANRLAEMLLRHPPLQIGTAGGQMQYRQAGNAQIAPTHLLLHGIGSGSASWVHQLERATSGPNRNVVNVLAWDAPGYGFRNASIDGDSQASTDLTPDAPTAADYAQRLWQWLDAVLAAQGQALASAPPVTLVGHSLGCLMAAAAARMAPGRVRRLLLLSPAQGYARASAEDRARKLNDRLDTLARLGPQGIAEQRGAAMLSPDADAPTVRFMQSVMAQVRPRGYSQAAHMLSGGDLLADLTPPPCPVAVASGSADTVTPPAGCQAVAAHAGAPYTSLPGAGHACALESPEAVSALIGLSDTPLKAIP